MDKSSLKQYFSDKYKGWDSFLKKIIFPIFGEDEFEEEYEAELLEKKPELQLLAEQTGVSSVKMLGHIYVGATPLQLFDITVSDRVMMERNRVSIQLLIRRAMDTNSAAFMVFHYNNDERWDWRFSYCQKGSSNEDSTDRKRYTFLLGPGQSCRTAAENFMKLYENRNNIEIDDITEAFSVEKLSAEFFKKYKQHYEDIIFFITGKRMVKKGNKWEEKSLGEPNEEIMAQFAVFNEPEKAVRDYVKKLMGRLVFLQFLQKKGWLGVPNGKDWGDGDREFVQNLFNNYNDKDHFVDNVLEPLFNDLNSKREGDMANDVVGVNIRIPYLNGGLFERGADDETLFPLPAQYMQDMLDFFASYNFTIDENDPNDAEVGVDPEMLGRIFENLLEDNKDKGAYYTPKEIVQYMCRESLIAYLQTDIENETEKDTIRQFVSTHDAETIGSLKSIVVQRLRDVKICDPAIGSGAFPMGLLRELFACRSALEPNIADNAADIKRHIIQNNIYGVDIERGAVDIARLRFWLSLIVDEKSPETLPNLDFKIIQGNSLMTTFEGKYINLSSEQFHANADQIRIKKQRLGELQNNFYNAQEDEKNCIAIDIKLLILDIIELQLTAERQSWFIRQHQTGDLFGETSRQISIGEEQATRALAPEKQEVIDKCKTLKDNLRDNNKTLEQRVNINIPFFDWKIMFHNVFSLGGFDIVIGNPPYIQLQKDGGSFASLYQPCGYQTFARTGDIYCLFYERGWQLLKQGGHLCYITSNKWMRAGYGEKTREFFSSKTNPILLIDFAGIKIFESATVDTNILLFAKGENKYQTMCALTDKQNNDGVNNLSIFVQKQNTICEFNSSDSWVILSPIEQSIKRKIEAVGTPLKDWNIQINYGIKTGFNDAFIISTDKRNEILSNCADDDERKRTAELIRPILRGRDIKRYGYEWANLWLIYIPWHFPYQFDDSIQGASESAEFAFKEQYPAVYSHMLRYKEPLSKRNKAETGIRYEWYAMQRWGAKYWEDFYKPKLFYADITQRLNFCLCKEVMFCNNTTYFISTEDISTLEHIYEFLNSPLIDWYYRTLSVQLGEKAVRMFSIYVLEIPIPKKMKKNIYETYGLTDEEIRYIENKVTIYQHL